MTTKILLYFTTFAIILAAHSVCLAGDPDSGYGTNIAIEFKVDNKSYKPPMVGHLEYTGFSIDVVSIILTKHALCYRR